MLELCIVCILSKSSAAAPMILENLELCKWTVKINKSSLLFFFPQV